MSYSHYPSCSFNIQTSIAPALETSEGGMAHKEPLKGIRDHEMLQGQLPDSPVVIKYPVELLADNLIVIPFSINIQI